MLRKGISALICTILFSCSAQAFAETSAPITLDSHDIAWGKLPSDPNLQYSVLAGKPSKEGLFIVRLKLPKNYRGNAHTHHQVMYDTIISGAYHLGFGNAPDKYNTQELDAGDFVMIPAKTKHYGYTNKQTVIQITGMGPWKALETAGPNR